MTRQEQISEAAKESVELCCGTSAIIIAFEKGAEWADANPSEENWCPIELRNKNNALEHDHKIMKEALENIYKLEQIYPDGTKVASPASYVAEEALSKLKVK